MVDIYSLAWLYSLKSRTARLKTTVLDPLGEGWDFDIPITVIPVGKPIDSIRFRYVAKNG